VVGLAWSNDPDSYAGSSLATGRAFHARRVEGDDPVKKGYNGPTGWGFDVGQTTPPHKKYVLLRKYETKVHKGLLCQQEEEEKKCRFIYATVLYFMLYKLPQQRSRNFQTTNIT